MCDTMVALGNVTADGSVIFAKNSDREPNEAQQLVLISAQDHQPGAALKCTYIEIPQVEHTFAVLLSKPFWIWGAEMGANEHGVVIGNEAVFTRAGYDKAPGMIGMDYLRLGLERGQTALEALRVITSLLEQYGQGGNCGLTSPFFYHNSFLIADPREAWVLETAGKHWAAEKVKDVRSISNALTIGSQWDLASEHLVEYAMERKWCRGREDFDFARCYSDPLYTRLADANKRQCATTNAMLSRAGKITPADAMAALRQHMPPAGQKYRPDLGITGADVCMHAGWGPVRHSQTAGSMVAHLGADAHTCWLTGTAAPCTGVFKPVWLDASLPDTGPEPQATYTKGALWWQHELLHREVVRDFIERLPVFTPERDALEARFLEGARECALAPAAERRAFSEACFTEAATATTGWRNRIRDMRLVHRLRVPYAFAWKKFNREAGLG
ncbi:MAG TPA: C69 family dipeptidase [Anaerolineaceae bacterium]